MKRPRKHHYVPQCLLKHFVNSNGQVYVLDKKTLQIFQSNIQDVFAERDFYTIGTNNRMESFFSQEVETKCAPVIDKIISKHSLLSLSESECNLLIDFCIIQNERTNMRKKAINTMLQSLLKIVIPIWERNGTIPPKPIPLDDVKINCTPTATRLQSELILENTPLFRHILKKTKKIMLFHSATSIFHIGDHPVAMNNEKPTPPFGAFGYAVPCCDLYFPLSPHLCIAMIDKHSALYSEIPDMNILPVSPNTTNALNILQIRWANRHIISSENNFQKDILYLEEEPYFKEHNSGEVAIQ